MKKIFRSISLIIAFLVTSVCFVGCDGSFKVKQIQSRAMFSENEIVLPIQSDYALLGLNSIGLTTFRSNKNIEAIHEIIKGNPLLSTQKFYSESENMIAKGDALLLMRNNDNGTKDCFSFILMNKASSKEYTYQFNSLRLEVLYADSKGDKASFWTLIPYYLLNGIFGGEHIYMNVEYETKATIDDFYAFYENCGWFNMEKETNSILIKGLNTNLEVVTQDANPNFAYRIAFRTILDLTFLQLQKA